MPNTIKNSKNVGITVFCGLILLLSCPAFSADAPPQGFESLFNGSDLTGWKRHDGLPGHDGVCGKWFVEDNAIVGIQDPPGKGGFLTTLKSYKDFELLLETNIDWPFDSGIFLRVGPDGKSHQVTLDYRPNGDIGKIYCPWTAGDLFYNPDGIKYFKKDLWNKLRILCQGEPARIRVWLNNVLITDFQHTEQSTQGIPPEGTICLQIHPGGQGYDLSKARFRNLYIRELGPDPDRAEGFNNKTFSNTGAEQGFISIFNGSDLTGWDGDPRLWDVADGAIRGRTTPQNAIDENTFCIWRAGDVNNFILKLKFRIQNGNSGVQYRSYDRGLWSISGYQAEVCNEPAVGFLYDEGLRGSLAEVGSLVLIDPQDQKHVISAVADPAAVFAAYKQKDWNDYTITVRGNHIIHELNGMQTIELIDEGLAYQKCHSRGLIALQMHKGDPMTVEFKDIYVKHLANRYLPAKLLFNGKDLTGWTCPDDNVKSAWSVKDGCLCDAGSPTGYIRTTDDYTSYILRLQFRHLQKGNGGVLLRASGPDKNWPRCIEAQFLADHVADIWNVDQFPMTTDPARTKDRRTLKLFDSNEKPLTQWNQYEITLDQGNLLLTVNSLTQNFAENCETIPGKIGLQSEGAPMEFRNIVLIPFRELQK